MIMDKDVLVGLIERLRVMESGDVTTLENFYPVKGICNNLNLDDYNHMVASEAITQMFHSWSEFSGFELFPVGYDSFDATNKYRDNNKWLDNDYCNSRRRLAGHLANEFEKLLTA